MSSTQTRKKRRTGRPVEHGVRMNCHSTSLTPMERRRCGALAKAEGLSYSAWSRKILIAKIACKSS